VTRGDIDVAKPNLGIILFLVLLPLFVGLAGLKSPVITRFTEAPVGYGFTSEGVNHGEAGGHADECRLCAAAWWCSVSGRTRHPRLDRDEVAGDDQKIDGLQSARIVTLASVGPRFFRRLEVDTKLL
jgi:hypothetical protein